MQHGDVIAHHTADGVFYFRLTAVEARSCKRCGASFPVTDARQVFCTPRCADTVRKRRLRAQRLLRRLRAQRLLAQLAG